MAMVVFTHCSLFFESSEKPFSSLFTLSLMVPWRKQSIKRGVLASLRSMLVLMVGGCFFTEGLLMLAAVDVDCYCSLTSALSSCLNSDLAILLLV